MTKEEALKRADKMATEPDWFCPLISANCNPDCICFIKPYVRETVVGSINDYIIQYIPEKGECSNAMFYGYGDNL